MLSVYQRALCHDRSLIQQMFDLTDEETVHHFSFDISWHYALSITDCSYESSYLSLKTGKHLLHGKTFGIISYTGRIIPGFVFSG